MEILLDDDGFSATVDARTFLRQFPKGCPSCRAPKRLITFHDRTKGIPAAHAATLLNMLATAPKARSVAFAECQVCHEAWFWEPNRGKWISTEDEEAAQGN